MPRQRAAAWCRGIRRSVLEDALGDRLAAAADCEEARLRDLVNDEAMRDAMGAKAREHARQFSINEGWKLWETAYRTLL